MILTWGVAQVVEGGAKIGKKNFRRENNPERRIESEI